MDAEHGPAVEKLVHLKFSVKSLTSQWLLAFSSGNSLVPHFSLGLSTRGLSEAACGGASGVHVDLISKLPLSSSSEYAQRCYHPLRAARESVLSTLRALTCCTTTSSAPHRLFLAALRPLRWRRRCRTSMSRTMSCRQPDGYTWACPPTPRMRCARSPSTWSSK